MQNPLAFHSPTTISVFAGTSCGKTHLVARILENLDWCFDTHVTSVYFFYAQYQPIYQELENTVQNITFFNSLPTAELLEGISNPEQHTLVILDDWGREAADSQIVESLFVRQSHHCNISVILLTQNLYFRGSRQRTQNLNTHVNIFMKNPTGGDQISTFARQRYPGRSKEFISAFHKATAEPFTYLVIDSHPKTEPQYSIRTGIFPGDDIIVWKFP